MATTTKLITISDFENYRDITSNLEEERMNPYILEAQRFELRSFLGDALYRELLEAWAESPIESKWDNLVSGCSYENSAGDTIYYHGIIPVIVYYSYARFVLAQVVNVTRFGVVKKLNEHSEQIDDKSLNMVYTRAVEAGDAYLREVELYLDENYADFDNWGTGEKKYKGKVTITKVNKV